MRRIGDIGGGAPPAPVVKQEPGTGEEQRGRDAGEPAEQEQEGDNDLVEENGVVEDAEEGLMDYD